MRFANTLEKLNAFRQADKYKTFNEVQCGISSTSEDRREIIEQILDNCCKELIRQFEASKKPLQNKLKSVIETHMNDISNAPVDNANKDFAYELCWYLSEIAGLKYKLRSERKEWGYWKVNSNEVKVLSKKASGKKNTKNKKSPHDKTDLQ